MIDFERVEGFDWDDGNARKSERHGVAQSEAEQVFFDLRLLVIADVRHSQTEPRFHGLGATLAGKLLHVTFTLRMDGKKIRVISARGISRKERIYYDQKT
jgi:uncharacterized DUF497 family protein